MEAALEMATELAAAHGVIIKLVVDMRATGLSEVQAEIVDRAASELCKSQDRMLCNYADMLARSKPGKN
jgi:hypothetical protein